MPPVAGANDVAALVQMGDAAEAKWLVDHVNGNVPQGLRVPIQIRFANNPKGAGKGNGLAPVNGGPAGTAPSAAKLAIKPPLPPPPPTAAVRPVYKPPPSRGAAGRSAPFAPAVASGRPSDRLYVSGFSRNETVERVRAAMTQYGRVAACKQLTLPPGQGCSAWLVQMSDLEEATWLVENLNRNIPTGFTEPVEVRFYPNILTGPRGAAGRSSTVLSPPSLVGRGPRRHDAGLRGARLAGAVDAVGGRHVEMQGQIGDRAPHELSSVSRRASRREPRGLLTYCNQEKIKSGNIKEVAVEVIDFALLH
eukprot:CAMPEP_0175789732 /NCGR_PEP_ID=MMETSP0097-20121207/81552_1 /TAXON_ID=311494 /ORGANISM="Alexandrium monilatum, Strain CCMP3105" /LENGTH=306 /DNA_ID=CAMNT_0017100797 /DNA_START=112 /DNA_END=1029 /DNA_ORIENTATION=+